MGAREKVANYAKSVVGLSANPGDAARREAYIDLIAPGETRGMVDAMVRMSGCALVVAGIWRLAGVDEPQLRPPYKPGSAVSRLVAVARTHSAWVTFSKGSLPCVGDAVLIGDNGTGGTEHFYTVTSVDPSTEILESVDGGQRDGGGFQAIAAKKRTWRTGRDVVFMGTDPGSKAVGGRRIVGWVDVAKLGVTSDEDIYGP